MEKDLLKKVKAKLNKKLSSTKYLLDSKKQKIDKFPLKWFRKNWNSDINTSLYKEFWIKLVLDNNELVVQVAVFGEDKEDFRAFDIGARKDIFDESVSKLF